MEITAELEHYHGLYVCVYGKMFVYIITIHMHAGRHVRMCMCVYIDLDFL